MSALSRRLDEIFAAECREEEDHDPPPCPKCERMKRAILEAVGSGPLDTPGPSESESTRLAFALTGAEIPSWYELATTAMRLASNDMQQAILKAHRAHDHQELGRLIAYLWSTHCTMANLSTLTRMIRRQQQ